MELDYGTVYIYSIYIIFQTSNYAIQRYNKQWFSCLSVASRRQKLREWRIEERTCSVKFYNTEPLSQFDSIILRLIDSTESGKITREELGLTLGFDIANRSFGSKRYYKDSAEVSLFNKLLDSVMMWNLIIEESEDENTKDESLDISDSTEKNENVTEENHKKSNATKYIRLTRLGHKALDMNCKFSFFSGEKVVMSNVNKSEYLEDTENFPFSPL